MKPEQVKKTKLYQQRLCGLSPNGPQRLHITADARRNFLSAI